MFEQHASQWCALLLASTKSGSYKTAKLFIAILHLQCCKSRPRQGLLLGTVSMSDMMLPGSRSCFRFPGVFKLSTFAKAL